jgi:hypothetical protein
MKPKNTQPTLSGERRMKDIPMLAYKDDQLNIDKKDFPSLTPYNLGLEGSSAHNLNQHGPYTLF